MTRRSVPATRPAARPAWSASVRVAAPATSADRAVATSDRPTPSATVPAADVDAAGAGVHPTTPPAAPVSAPPPRAYPTRMARKRAERRRGRIVAAVAVAALVVAMTAVGGTVAAMAKTVTIAVDGTSRQVTTLSGTVAGALDAAGVHLGAHDTLAPASDAAIGDGSQIVVRRGRVVTVTIDGTPRTFWTTARTVEAALAQIGRDAADFKLSADRSRQIPLDGLALTADTLHTVTLAETDGATVAITTTATTVGDLLRGQGIHLAADQEVHPAPDTLLSDGLTITVTTLPTVTLVQGSDSDRIISHAATVGDLLAAQGIEMAANKEVTPRPDTAVTSGMRVTVTTLPTVTVANGAAKAVTVIARQPTVGDLLSARGITLGKHDTVRPELQATVTDGMTVTITRISYATTTKTVTIPQPEDVVTYSDSMPRGTQQVTEGHSGVEKITYRIKTVNGKAGKPQETGRSIEVEAAPTVTVVGTKAPPTTAPPTAPTTSAAAATPTTTVSSSPPTATSSSSSRTGTVETVGNQVFFHDFSYGVNWDGLAHCESTNNPRAVNPSGRYFGLFQFDLSTWRSVGGSGNPIDASPEEQLMRAKKLYLARGLQPWACAWAAH